MGVLPVRSKLSANVIDKQESILSFLNREVTTTVNAVRNTLNELITEVPTFDGNAVNDPTPSVANLRTLITANTAATTIEDFDDGKNGQTVVVIIGDSFTTVDFTSSSLRGNVGADWSPDKDDHMICTLLSGVWYCRISDNTA